jgi:hypothetical protein
VLYINMEEPTTQILNEDETAPSADETPDVDTESDELKKHLAYMLVNIKN